MNSGALIREARSQRSPPEAFIRSPSCISWFICNKKNKTPGAHLDHRLLGDGAGPPLASVQALLDGETAAVGFEALHQQVVDSSKVVVAFVLQRLERKKKKRTGDKAQYYWRFTGQQAAHLQTLE